jgi:CO/xanthine dehydrogenase Mo-binding subunit
VANGRLCRGALSYSFAEVVGASKGAVSLKGLGSYSARHSADTAFVGLDHWTPGAAAAEIEIDLDTGEVRVMRYAAVADAGRAIHYLSAQRQVEGGIVMGLGNALFEELRYEEGQLQNADAFQYRLPLLRDVPLTLPVAIVENGDGPGPFGAKGMSQTSIPCVAPAINNAIYDAVGVYLRSVPFTPEKVLRAVGALERLVSRPAVGPQFVVGHSTQSDYRTPSCPAAAPSGARWPGSLRMAPCLDARAPPCHA